MRDDFLAFVVSELPFVGLILNGGLIFKDKDLFVQSSNFRISLDQDCSESFNFSSAACIFPFVLNDRGYSGDFFLQICIFLNE